MAAAPPSIYSSRTQLPVILSEAKNLMLISCFIRLLVFLK